MRILPILMAIIVAVILYFAIIDRDAGRSFLGLTDDTTTQDAPK